MVALLAPLQAALAAAGPSVSSDHTSARLVSEAEAIAPGEPFWVALRLEMAEGWHTYFKNPGASGERTQIDWELPEGFTAGAIQWPAPEPYDFGGFLNYVYHGTVLLPVQITPPADLEPGQSVTLKALAHWLECEAVCIPAYDMAVSVTVEVARQPRPSPRWQPAIEKTLASLPPALPEGFSASHERRDDAYVITVRREAAGAPRLEGLSFIATQTAGTTGPAPVKTSREQGFEVLGEHAGYRLTIPANNAWPEDRPFEALKGYLRAEPGWGDGVDGAVVALAAGAPVTASADAIDTAEAASGTGGGKYPFWALLGIAFLGGLILNLMPCVFPVLGIKVMGFVNQAGEARGRILEHGLLFSLGVLVSFWALGLVIVLLRSGVLTFIDVEETGWGFWLQLPTFVFALALVLFVFAMNLSGVFEIGTTVAGKSSRFTGHSGKSGTFFSGALAVAVGTPCAAPFLASALAGVFTLPTVQIFLLLTVMGAGLALPYLLLSAFPKWIRALPRAGPWMETFKQVMAFPLYGTAGFLLWTFAGQVSDGLMLTTVISFTVIALGAYVYGRFGASPRPLKARVGTALATALVIVPTAWVVLELRAEQRQAEQQARIAQAQAKEDELRARQADLKADIALLREVGASGADRLETLRSELTRVTTSLAQAREQLGTLRRETEGIAWESWSPQKQQALLAEGRTVYVDFTARWCVTCQTNKVVYKDRDVIDAFKANDVVALKADWTNRNATIAAELNTFGRKAIPFNVVYGRGAEQPVTLPEILTPGAVLEAVREAAGEGQRTGSPVASSR